MHMYMYIYVCNVYIYIYTYTYIYIYIYIYISLDNTLNKKNVDYYQNFTWDVLHILQEIIARPASSSVFKQVNVLVVEF